MDLFTWLGSEFGRSIALAAHLGVSKSAVSQWQSNGIPILHMQIISDYTAGEVTLADMVTASIEAKTQQHTPA